MRIIVGDRQSSDVLLNLDAQIGNQFPSGFRQHLGDDEGGHRLNQCGEQHCRDDYVEQMDLCPGYSADVNLSNHAIDEVLGFVRQNQTGRPVDDDQRQRKKEQAKPRTNDGQDRGQGATVLGGNEIAGDCSARANLYRFHCYCELSGNCYVQLFLTEKLRRRSFLQSTTTVKTVSRAM